MICSSKVSQLVFVSFIVFSSAISSSAAQAADLTSQLPHRTLFPVGGGYDTALKGFSASAARFSGGSVVNIVVVPATFADDPVTPDDLALLQEDVQAIQDMCNQTVDKIRFPRGCVVTSVPLFVAADASNSSVVNALNSQTLHGVFFTGGLQDYAMKILAGTPSEAALAMQAARGVAFGGSSAGAALQSFVMNAGYTDTGYYDTGLLKASIDIWFNRPALKRGLVFGSRKTILDEHVYSRGRLGRMFNATAQTADVLGGGGLLGVGCDYDSGVVISDDRWLSDVAGVSTCAVVDFKAANTRYRWLPAGSDKALSARRIVTHLLPKSASVKFDIDSRRPVVNGRSVELNEFEFADNAPMTLNSRGTLMIAGDLSADLNGAVIKEFVRQASRRPNGKLLIVAAGYATPNDAQTDVTAYAQALSVVGWRGLTRSVIYGQSVLDKSLLKDVSAVLFIGADQSLLPPVLSNAAFRNFALAAAETDVVMFEHAMGAIVGDYLNAVGEGSSLDDAIAMFQRGQTALKPGLGLIRGANFEVRLQTDKRWGRLFGVSEQKRQTSVYGISESTALIFENRRARVLGLSAVVAVDPRRATFIAGENTAIGALNMLVDVYQSGETIGQ